VNSPPAPPHPFRVLVTVGTFEPGSRGGGPVRSVANILDSTSSDVKVTLVTRDRDLGSDVAYAGLSGKWVDRGLVRVFYLNTRSPRQWWELWRKLRTTQFDLLYVNSLWDPISSLVPIGATRAHLLRIPQVLIAPRGELSPGALSLKVRKKALFLKLWARVLRGGHIAWHAFTEREATEIIAAIPWADTIVNQSQVSLPDEALEPADVSFGQEVRLVYIGRISPKKNLLLSLAALKTISTPVRLNIFGPLEDPQYWASCLDAIQELPKSVSVRYLGELEPTRVRQEFSLYDAFLFPTLGENFGHTIAESLSASCPVICADNTPWTQVLGAGGGRILGELSVQCLASEIEMLLNLDPAERAERRRAAGRAFKEWRRGIVGYSILDQLRHRYSGDPADDARTI